MKRFLSFTLIFMLVIAGAAYRQRRTQKIAMKISLIRGVGSNCLIKRRGKSKWKVAKIRDKLKMGDEIKTLEGVRVELRSDAGVVVRLNQKSRFTVKKLKKEKKTFRARMKLWLGKGWFKVKKVTKRRLFFESETPSAVAGVYGTTYRMNVGDDKATSVRVYSGKVEVENAPYEPAKVTEVRLDVHEVEGPKEVPPPMKEVPLKEWREIVTAQQELTIMYGRAEEPTKKEFDLEEDEKEEWVRWNKERDAQLGWE